MHDISWSKSLGKVSGSWLHPKQGDTTHQYLSKMLCVCWISFTKTEETLDKAWFSSRVWNFYHFSHFLILRHSICVILMMASECNKILNFSSCYTRLLYDCEYTYLLEDAVARIVRYWGGVEHCGQRRAQKEKLHSLICAKWLLGKVRDWTKTCSLI